MVHNKNIVSYLRVSQGLDLIVMMTVLVALMVAVIRKILNKIKIRYILTVVE